MIDLLYSVVAVTALAVGSHLACMRIIAFLDARHSRR
jgi:hypothetical protein